jgi:hypothetical protein
MNVYASFKIIFFINKGMKNSFIPNNYVKHNTKIQLGKYYMNLTNKKLTMKRNINIDWMKTYIFYSVINFVWINGGLNQDILYFDFFGIIGISKHISATSYGDIGLDIIKLEINCNCDVDAF